MKTTKETQPAKEPFAHYMLKEVYEQPGAIRETLQRHLTAERDRVFLDAASIPETEFASFSRIMIAASGASRHAGMAGKHIIEAIAGVPVEVEHASEYGNRSFIPDPGTLVVLISQSGETADVISAQREVQAKGSRTLAICNVADSTLVREANAALFTYAGREIAVPATKSFTAQLTALYVFSLFLAQQRQRLSRKELDSRIREFENAADKMELLIHDINARCRDLARRYFMAHTFYFVGRAIHFPIALEGALKLKEISYIHAEGYPTGELVHGPVALLEPSFPVVAIATRDIEDVASMDRYRLTLGNLRKVRERSECLILLASEGDEEIAGLSEDIIVIPKAPELLLPVLEIVPLQLLAYYIAVWNHYDVDRPRNLVKSVHTE